jgi:periplasmic protein TonB
VPLPSLITSSLFVMPTARSLPVIVSVVLHASLGAGLVVSAGTHGRPGASLSVVPLELEVEALEAPLLAPVAPPTAPEAPVAAHSHPYPVAASHDAHAHDPAQHHDPAPAEHDAPAAHAEAAPAIVADGTAMPRFTLASGSGAPMGAHVAASATGAGSGGPPGGGGGDEDVVHAASSVHIAARLVSSVPAAYPLHARTDELEGEVGVEIVVDREGRVIDARVTRPAGHGFDAAALAAVRAYRFSPAVRAGRAVRVRMPWSVQFRLR